jgi:hypothetical protein
MATYGHTFTSGDTLTPTKLNAARTVTEIVNADINASAAIAGTKIDPDFGAQAVDTTGNVTAARLVAAVAATACHQSPSRVTATRAFFTQRLTR